MIKLQNVINSKLNPYESEKNCKKSPKKPRLRRQIILSLLNEERYFQHQNYQALLLKGQQSKDQKPLSKAKSKARMKTIKEERGLTITPKFRQHLLSESKLPPLKPREERELTCFEERLAPWEQKESRELMRPLSSRFLPY